MIFLEMTPDKLTVLLTFLGGLLLILGLIYWGYQSQVKKIENTQDKLSDKNFLLLFEKEPDGFLTVDRLIKKSGLSKSEAKFRFNYFQHQGLIKYSYTNKLKYYYRLIIPVVHKDYPALSEQPFLTVEDILKIFKVCDYSVSVQEICLATGLPISIIKKEMKFFEKENIIESLTEYAADGMSSKKYWVLKEPYRTNPDQFLALEEKFNIELEKIYREELSEDDLV